MFSGVPDLVLPDCTSSWKYIFNFAYNYRDTAAWSMACAPYLIMSKQQRPTWKVSGNQHSGEDCSLNRKAEWERQTWIILCYESVEFLSQYAGTIMEIYFQFSPGIELAQALHSLLPMHHGGHCGPLLNSKIEKHQFDQCDWKHLKSNIFSFKRLRDGACNSAWFSSLVPNEGMHNSGKPE